MKTEDNISGIPEGGAAQIVVYADDERRQPICQVDSTYGDPNIMKSRWGPHLKSKSKDVSATKKTTKKAAKKAAKNAAKKAAKKGKKNKFYCDTCDKYCTSETTLEQHKRSRKHKKRLNHRCDICNKSFSLASALEQHLRSEKHKRRLGKQPPETKNNDAISPSSEHQLISDDSSYAQSGTVNWNEMYNEQFHDNNRRARIADANREWSRANSQVYELQSIAPNMMGLQPDECQSTNQLFQSSANSANETQANSNQYAQNTAEPKESHVDKHSTYVSKSNGNLMKLTAQQALQTSYPQGCHVIYSFEKDFNDSEDTLIRIGTVHAVYIDMSFSRQLIYEIKPNKTSPDAMVFVEEHVLALAPKCPILFHKTPYEASASAKEDEKALKGIVLACQWSIVKLSYTILLQHSTADEYSILKTNVSGENISYRPPNSRS